MGVTGLWKLIEPCGTPVPIETLEGKILAVDISIWLHQVVKGFQDSSGSALAHAHLLGLFHRLCKLMFYRVKPVFVFDGCVPQLKRDTIAKRQQQRSKLNTEADRIQNLLLEQLAKEQVVQKALGNAVSELLPIKRISNKPSAKEDDEMFKLPELPSTSQNNSFGSSQDESSVMETSLDSSDEEEEENCAQRYYTNNLQAIDVKSKDFRSLPADMRYDILVDIKETRKQSSWGRLHELPAQSDDFSSFQMKRLLKRRAVQESLQEAEKEMGGRTLTYAELQTYFKEEGVLEETAFEEASRQLASDENTRFLLVQDLKKQLTEKKEVSKLETIKEEDKEVEIKEEAEKKCGEYEADLQLAIALSLSEQESGTLYKEEDYILKDKKLKLNKIQREVLKHAAKGPAKTYMIEHAGMNQDEVVEILENSQICETKEKVQEMLEILQVCEKKDRVQEEEEVKLSSESESEEISPEAKKLDENPLEVVINLDEPIKVVDDLFADVFSEKTKHDISMDSDSDEDLIEVATLLESSQYNEKAKFVEAEHILKEQKIDLVSSKNQVETSHNSNEEVKENLDEIQEIVLESSKNQVETNQESNEEIESQKEKEKVLEDHQKIVLESSKNQVLLNTQDIFEEMRKQMENVQKIDLNNVEIKNDIIDVDAIEEMKTPLGTPKKSNSKPVTPSRITDFFNTDYVVKKTPDKLKQEEEEVAKVKSPFFIRKTPKSKTPKKTETPTKAVKELFPEVTAEDILTNAADELKQKKSQQELRSMASDLAKERRDLESERNRQDRMGMSISQRMSTECQELLQLFGVPYIVAPMEAEAQCAFLDAVQLTHGTITDDSDIWLFGGRTVYKNFFVQNKHVLKFSADEIETQFKCDRHTLVQLACLVGSDYTTGVHGIGAVTALEILSSFTRNAAKSAENMQQRINLIVDTLQRFRDWWQTSKMSAISPGSSARHTLLKKLKNIELNDGFPNPAVIEAYLLPKVDESRTAFSWGQPDVESIREFTRKTFGWTTTKTDEMLNPVLKRLSEKRTQTTMRNYFLTSNAVKSRELKVSKRVQGAIQRLAVGGENATEEEVVTKKAKRSNAKLKRKAAKEDVTKEEASLVLGEENATTEEGLETKKTKKPASKLKRKAAKEDVTKEESSSATTKEGLETKEAKKPNLRQLKFREEPNTSSAAGPLGRKRIPSKEIIPQREKDLEEMRKKKELAATLFKESNTKNKRKKK